jgi:hypothetical protein
MFRATAFVYCIVLLPLLGACGERTAAPDRRTPPVAANEELPPGEAPVPAGEVARRQIPDDFPLRPMEGGELQRVEEGMDGERRFTNVIVHYPLGLEDELASHFVQELERAGIEARQMDRGSDARRTITFRGNDASGTYGVMINRRGEQIGVTISWNRRESN